MTRAADVANFTSGIGSATSPTTIGAGFTVTNSGDVTVGGALTASSLNVTGLVKVGSGITIDGVSGIITATTINATNFVGNGSGLTGAGSTVSDDTSTNATFYPLFTQTTSGTVTSSGISTSKLSFNPSTGTLTATKFVGDGSGLTGAGSTVSDDTSTNATFYPVLTQTTTGTITSSKVSTTKLSFNPSTGILTATSLGGNLANTLTLNTSGTGLTGSTTFNNSGAATFTVTSNATSANTASAIVARDASGNFTAGTITAALTGNSTTATTLQTARAINGVSFNGSAAIEVNPSSGAYSNGYGARTVSTSGPGGGSDGDIWYQY